LAWKGFFAWSQTGDVLCTDVHKQRGKVRGGERIDGRKELTSKLIMLFVCVTPWSYYFVFSLLFWSGQGVTWVIYVVCFVLGFFVGHGIVVSGVV
jgi:fatty acid desaturase